MPWIRVPDIHFAISSGPYTIGNGGERTVEAYGVRLVGSLPAVWIGLAGFCVGLVLVFVGDRAHRQVARRRARRRFRSSRAGVISVRGRR